MTNLVDTDVFKRCKQPLLEAGVITKDFMLSDRYNELFYSYKGQYVMESLMYPMFMFTMQVMEGLGVKKVMHT